MKKDDLKKRIFALMLSVTMVLSMTGYAFADETEAENADSSESQMLDEVAPEENADSGTAESIEKDPAENNEAGQDVSGEAEADEEALLTEDESNIKLNVMADDDVADISVKAAGDERFITAVWAEVEKAQQYKVYLDGIVKGTPDASECKFEWVFPNTDASVSHEVTVEAYDAEGKLLAQGSAGDISPIIRGKLSGSKKKPFKAKAVKLNMKSLRTLLGEGNGGMSVAQGAATDGTYAYYMLSSSGTQNGRVLKIRLSDNKVIARSPKALPTHHSNGMTYDSKRKCLVAVGCGKYRNQLSFIDPVTLQVTSQENLNYKYAGKISGLADGAENNGIAAISYIEKYDVYLARSRGYNSNYSGTTSKIKNNIWVFDADSLEAVGHIFTKISADFPETYQSMDADEKYVYFLLSKGSGQPNNIILALDWNSEKLLPVVNGNKKFVDKMWYCNNDGVGKPDAVIRIPTSHEVEGLYHTTDSKGAEHFYVSEYYGRWKYKTVTKKKKIKVKWKKVKKKVKWKKDSKGKWKYKKKKVWKYKTKTKKYKVKVRDYWARDNYVYDLGVI